MLILIGAVLVGYVERTSIAHVIPYIRSETNFDPITLGYIFSAFGWGYVVGLPFSGLVISRLGYRRTLGLLGFGWSISAFLFCISHSAFEMILARFALGLMEAPLFPLFVSWIGRNGPYETGSFRISIVDAASYIGMALSGPLTVTLATQWGWRAAYALVGSLPLLVIMTASILQTNTTQIQQSKNVEATFQRKGTPSAARIASFIACSLGFLFYNFAKSFHGTWLPGILVQSFGFSSMSAANVTFLQSTIAPVASIAFGFVSMRLISRGFGLEIARLTPMAIGFGFGCLIALIPFLQEGINTILILSFVGIISTSALIWSVPQDLSSDPSGVAYLAGYLNAIANIGTIASPIAVGYLISQPSGHISVLFLLGCISLSALISFSFGYYFIRPAGR